MIALVGAHRAVRDIRLVGSRAEGRAIEQSDWDFRVEVGDFPAMAEALPRLLAPLDPLAQQWDRLSLQQCWMLMLRGPVKVDLIFPDESHALEPPWRVRAETLDRIDAHFWDWILWLDSKHARGRHDVVATELQKLFDHLLAPLGVARRPSSIAEAVVSYRTGRERAERTFDVAVSRLLENEVAPALTPNP